MNGQHTPGPWFTCQHAYFWEIRVKDTDKVLADVFLGGLGMAYPTEEVEANARLIAAAPDLLAALIELADSIWADSHISGHHVQDALPLARAAITKATGEVGP